MTILNKNEVFVEPQVWLCASGIQITNADTEVFVGHVFSFQVWAKIRDDKGKSQGGNEGYMDPKTGQKRAQKRFG